MKRVSILALLVLILAVGALPAAAVTEGEPDGDGHPNVGLMVADIDGVPKWRCSGTLIAPRVFLTLGRCTYGATGARVWFDTDLRDNPEYPYGGETSYEGEPITHPDYHPEDPDPRDVGVVILDDAVTDIEPAMLPSAGFLSDLKKDRILGGGHEEGVYFRLVGYGSTDLIRLVAECEYVSLNDVYLRLSQKAAFSEGGASGGEYGGPAFWFDDEGNEILVAVIAPGGGQGTPTGTNYRVDTPTSIAFIQAVMENLP